MEETTLFLEIRDGGREQRLGRREELGYSRGRREGLSRVGPHTSLGVTKVHIRRTPVLGNRIWGGVRE